MQAVFANNQQGVNEFRKALSEPRFARYLAQSNGKDIDAIYLYHWNCSLAQSLYFPLHMWEITFRNKLNAFLYWKYQNANWPYDQKLVRQLKGNDEKRLREARERQESLRRVNRAPTDAIVADLSAGFWVSLLTNAYTIPFVWRTNIGRIFPNNGALAQGNAWSLSNDLLDVRNRIAHHEPIFHLQLAGVRTAADQLLVAMSATSSAYANACCTFWPIWNAGPPKAT